MYPSLFNPKKEHPADTLVHCADLLGFAHYALTAVDHHHNPFIDADALGMMHLLHLVENTIRETSDLLFQDKMAEMQKELDKEEETGRTGDAGRIRKSDEKV